SRRLGVTFALLATAGLAAGPQRDEAAAPRQVVRLFNGRDLDGWTPWLVDAGREDPRGVFTVEGGLLRISGDGYGYLRTDRAYRDYSLVAEFRWGDRSRPERERNARDAGLFLHAVGPDGNSYDGGGAYMAAVECQVMEGAVGDLLLIKGRDERGRDVPVRLKARVAERRDVDGWPYWDSDGEPVTLAGTGRLNWRDKDCGWKDVFGARGPQDAESPPGDWTRVECECRDDTIRVFVNGRLVNEATDVFPSAGYVLLQCEGSEVFFRRIELHPLPGD
ncbi:MAG TPA: DUF1080 domain-containing protein, partial [Planctomycetaceae bacterium]